MKKVLLSLLITATVWAAPYTVGQTVASMDYPDQFGKKAVFNEMPKTVIFACEKGTSTIVNDFLNSQNIGYLQKNSAVFVADISGMPRFIADVFALPKLQKFVHTVLLIQDEKEGLKFPSKEGAITIMKFSGNMLGSISYVSTAEQLKVAIEQ